MLKSKERQAMEDRTAEMKEQLEKADKQRGAVSRFQSMRLLLEQHRSSAEIVVNNATARIFERAGTSCWWPRGSNDEGMMAEIHTAVFPIIKQIFDKYERAANEQYDATLQAITGQPVPQAERNLRGIQVRDKHPGDYEF